MSRVDLSFWVALCVTLSCGTDAPEPCTADPWTCGLLVPGEVPDPWPGMPRADDVLDHLPRGEDQRSRLCARLAADGVGGVVRERFCGANAPQIVSLDNVLETLGLGFHGDNRPGYVIPPGAQGNPDFAFIGHSTALTRRLTNVLNPRAIILTPSTLHTDAEPGFVAVAFTRGEAFVEILSHDPGTNEIHFFLLTFRLPCHAADACQGPYLFTPAFESGWSDVTLYDEVDLENTTMDCLHCHKNGWRANPNPKKSPLMFEQNALWRHWLYTTVNYNGWTAKPQGPGPFVTMLEDYLTAHGEAEPHAGVPGWLKHASRPLSVQCLLEGNGFGNGFDATALDKDGRGEGLFESYYNKTRQPELAAMQLTGEIFAAPAAETDPADPERVRVAAKAYAAFLTDQSLPFPDLMNLIPEGRARDVGLASPEGLAPAALIVQSCTECHHSDLNSAITRARFNVDVRLMPNDELRVAQRRINLPFDHLEVMPPTRLRTWNGAERAAVTAYLQEIIDGRDAAPDGEAPTPGPATFESEPEIVGLTALVLRATRGQALRAPVEYYFDEITGQPGGDDSGWQLSPIYLDRGLTRGLEYKYTVRLRNADKIEGAVSAPVAAVPDGQGLVCLDSDVDADCDFLPDVDEADGDTDKDGTEDRYDADDDGDTLPTQEEVHGGQQWGDDPDNDGIPNWYDLDSDGDGSPDGPDNGNDTDGDGVVNHLDKDDP